MSDRAYKTVDDHEPSVWLRDAERAAMERISKRVPFAFPGLTIVTPLIHWADRDAAAADKTCDRCGAICDDGLWMASLERRHPAGAVIHLGFGLCDTCRPAEFPIWPHPEPTATQHHPTERNTQP